MLSNGASSNDVSGSPSGAGDDKRDPVRAEQLVRGAAEDWKHWRRPRRFSRDGHPGAAQLESAAGILWLLWIIFVGQGVYSCTRTVYWLVNSLGHVDGPSILWISAKLDDCICFGLQRTTARLGDRPSIAHVAGFWLETSPQA